MMSCRERFESKFQKSLDGCWNWAAGTNYGGYGVINIGGKTQIASRVAYTLYVDEIPKDCQVNHRCHNPACVRPAHLYLGTQGDNLRDMYQAGHRKPLCFRGEKNGNAKLSDVDVKWIRQLYANGKFTQSCLARSFGITQAGVSSIVLGRTRKVT